MSNHPGRPRAGPLSPITIMLRRLLFTGKTHSLLPEGQQDPEWFDAKVRRLLGLVEDSLAPLFPPGQETERLHAARVLWCGLHGITALVNAGAVDKSESMTALADSLLANYVSGLRFRASHSDKTSIPA